MITNMHDDALKNSIVNENLNFFCDLELILGLHAILPLLDYVHTLIKFAQSHNMFICNVIDTMKIYQLKLYNDPYNKINDPTFDELNVFETFTNKNLLSITNATYFTPYKWGKEGVFVKFFLDGHP
jgi:hypothetical protein